MYDWLFFLQELAGTKPLSSLAKKVPIFNRRDEIVKEHIKIEPKLDISILLNAGVYIFLVCIELWLPAYSLYWINFDPVERGGGMWVKKDDYMIHIP